jgi:hypothetical protein
MSWVAGMQESLLPEPYCTPNGEPGFHHTYTVNACLPYPSGRNRIMKWRLRRKAIPQNTERTVESALFMLFASFGLRDLIVMNPGFIVED